MYKVENDSLHAYVNDIVYIKQQNNGYFTICEENNAQGVVLDDKVYQIFGRKPIVSEEEIDSVIVTKFDDYKYYMDKLANDTELTLETQTALAELSILISTLMEEATNV